MGKSAYLVGHKEQGTHLEARVLRTQPLRVVLLFNVDKFFSAGNGFGGTVVVVAVLAGILAAIGNQQFGEAFDIEFEFGNHAAIGRACHGGKHGGEAGVAAEDFQHHEPLVGAGGGAQAIHHLNRARDASAEADAIVGARNVVVHGLGNADDFEAFFVQTNAVAQCVVAADGNERVNSQPGQILENFG